MPPVAAQVARLLGAASGPILEVSLIPGIWVSEILRQNPPRLVVSLQPGTVLQRSWRPPHTFALAILGQICHLLSEGENQTLMLRLLRVIRPEGSLVIVDSMLPEDSTSSDLFPFSAYVGWLRAAGYERVRRIDLTASPPASLITVHRRSP